MARPAQQEPSTFVIRPMTGWHAINLGEFWRARELMLFFAWRDLLARYKQTVLGVLWAAVQPLLMMVVFTLFLGRLANVPSEGVPYSVFALAGLVPWTLFANGVNHASESLASSASLLSKVYFPRLVLPIGTLLAWVPDSFIASMVLIVLTIAHGVQIQWTVIFLPLFLAAAVIVAASASLWIAPLNVAYRDVRYGVGLLMQVWLFATPVAYPYSLVPENLRPLMALNPMTGVVTGFRWSLIGGTFPPVSALVISATVALAALVTGLLYFRRVEPAFADVI